MASRLLMIHEGSHIWEGWRDLDGHELRCERIAWGSFRPDALQDCAAALVIPFLVPWAPQALSLFRWLKAHPISTPTLAVLPAEPEPELMHAAAEVVDDFVLWPVREIEWRQRVWRLLGRTQTDEASVPEQLLTEAGLAKLIGRAPAFTQTIAKIPMAARSGSPVLITGETGTGKELCARALHHLGPRRSFPFIPVDCGAVPDQLFENELFGHARGAFTDARGDQKGLVAMAAGGTLFLDEIDALSLPGQAKLLRFLQEQTFKPLGADRFVRADVNILAATNRDLEELVHERRFRSDLYFRLNVLSLHLAPLRSRREDIPLLARHFVEVTCAEKGLPRKTVSPLAVQRLMLHDWPGNVRELVNVIQRAVVFSAGRQILPCHVLSPSSDDEQREEPPHFPFRQARAQAVETFERSYVESLLCRHGGNVTRAAREAQKDRRAFGRLAKKYGVQRPRP
jgi:DNA-binding NtrC family response regulator